MVGGGFVTSLAQYLLTFPKSGVVSRRGEADLDGLFVFRDARNQIGDLAGGDAVLALDEPHDARGGAAALPVATEVSRRGGECVAAQGVAAAAEGRRGRVHASLSLTVQANQTTARVRNRCLVPPPDSQPRLHVHRVLSTQFEKNLPQLEYLAVTVREFLDDLCDRRLRRRIAVEALNFASKLVFAVLLIRRDKVVGVEAIVGHEVRAGAVVHEGKVLHVRQLDAVLRHFASERRTFPPRRSRSLSLRDIFPPLKRT